MMKIKRIEKAENCLEGKNVYDVYFETTTESDFINSLTTKGKLVYITTFELPFYRLIVRGKFTIKGIEGAKTAKIIFPDDVGEEFLEEALKIFE